MSNQSAFKLDELSAAAEASRRGYGGTKTGGFVEGVISVVQPKRYLAAPSLRRLAWRNEGAEWARQVLNRVSA